LSSPHNDFKERITVKARHADVHDVNDLKLDLQISGDGRVDVGGKLDIQGRAVNMQLTSVDDTVFGPTRVDVDLKSISTAGSILQTAPLEVLQKTDMRAAVKIELPHIDNNLVNGFTGVAPSVFVVGDRVAEAAAAAAAAAAANASAAKSVIVKDLDLGAGRNRLLVTSEPLSGVKVQSQGGALVIASDVKLSAQKTGLELVLSPTTAASPSATGSVAITNAAFVQVKSFEPLSVPSGSSFSFALQGDAFVHKDSNMPVELSAQTPSGDKLPDWLAFSPAERRFTGVAPQGVTQLEVMVKAVDANGVEATTSITLRFNSPEQ
jgi:hypothetical protein